MLRIKVIILVLVVHFFFVWTILEAWDNERTHRDLSELAARKSTLGAQDYLRNIGFSKGLDERISGKEVFVWLREGAFLEDAGTWWNAIGVGGTARYMNHFHNPLKPWAQAGLSDLQSGESALLWAQDKKKQETALAGDQSWPTTRDHYYYALTLKTEGERQAYFAQTFQGLGHQMHLIQDMAVPAHVRNDAHPLDEPVGRNYLNLSGDYYFETWAKKNSPIINSFAANPTKPDVDLTKKAPGLAPITQFYDTDQYTESFVPSTSLGWGLSEYTNANFVSDDTIFTEQFNKDDRHYFPYPRYTGYTQCYEQYEELYRSTNKMRKYWRKKAGGCAGEAVNHFVQVEPWFQYAPTWDVQRWALYLDEATHKDYAEKLIPRAVGYSAGLLNYFFRGDIRLSYETSGAPGFVFVNKTGERAEGDFTIYYDTAKDERYPVWAGKGYLESTMDDKTNTFDFIPPSDAKEPGKYIVVFKGKMGNEDGAVAGYVLTRRLEITPPSQFIYSMVDGSTTGPNFTRIRAKVKNASPSEQMQNGTVQAVAKYKADTNDTDFIYSVSETKAIDLSSNAPVEVEFNFDNDPVPVDATDLYLQVIFKGKIGTEDGVVAIGIKDISEPTPIDVFNDTDKSCVNGSWYSTADAIDQIDTNHNHIADEWDVNPHILQNIYVKISSTENPQNASPTVYNAVVPFLYPGEFKRVMYILTDYNFKYSFYETWIAAVNTDYWSHADKVKTYNGTAAKNQTDYTSDPAVCGKDPVCYNYYYPVYYSLRGHDMWWGGGIVFINGPYPADSSCQGY